MGDELEARLAPLMRAAQDGDAASYRALLRGCIPVIATIARQQGLSLITIHRARATYDPRRLFLP